MYSVTAGAGGFTAGCECISRCDNDEREQRNSGVVQQRRRNREGNNMMEGRRRRRDHVEDGRPGVFVEGAGVVRTWRGWYALEGQLEINSFRGSPGDPRAGSE